MRTDLRWTGTGRLMLLCALAGLPVSAPVTPAALATLRSGSQAAHPLDLLGATATVLHAVIAVAVVLALALLRTRRGVALAARVLPRQMVGLVVTGGLVTTALAMPAAADSADPDLNGLRLPDRPTISLAQPSSIQPSSIQPSSIQPSSIQPSPIQPSPAADLPEVDAPAVAAPEAPAPVATPRINPSAPPPAAQAPPPAAPAPAAPQASARPSSGADVVTVQAGDSLWRLAATHLGPDASTGQIAAAVAAWHDLNRATIGADPDLIHPGQDLTIPKEPTS